MNAGSTPRGGSGAPGATRVARVNAGPGGYSRIRRTFSLEREIEEMLRAERYALAVILCQTLLELRVAVEVDNLLEGFDAGSLGEAAFELIDSFSPANGKTKRFLETALEVRLPEEVGDSWQKLVEHNRRRNEIIHRGVEVSESEARASLATVERVSWRLHQLTLRRIGAEPELEEDERIKREEEGLPPDGEEEWEE